MKVLCRTLFDCTYTGVTGYFRESRLPYTSKTGMRIATADDWNRARNQQRNWESVLQIISLRTQPVNLVYPVKQSDGWHFEFEVEAEGVLGHDLSGLIADCESVPMITGLDEDGAVTATLHAQGTNQNIWFTAINTAMETVNGYH